MNIEIHFQPFYTIIPLTIRFQSFLDSVNPSKTSIVFSAVLVSMFILMSNVARSLSIIFIHVKGSLSSSFLSFFRFSLREILREYCYKVS